MSQGLERVPVQTHAVVIDAQKSWTLLFFKARREPAGRRVRNERRIPHLHPGGNPIIFHYAPCKKKKKKRKKRNRHRVSSFLLDEQNPRLGSAVIFSCCVLGFNHGEGHGTACVPHITSFHHRGSRMLRERQETGPEALVSPLV